MTIVGFSLVGIQVVCGIPRMFLYSIISIFFTILLETCSVAINNGFSFKFNPVSAKEDVKVKSFGALFAKIPQEITSMPTNEILSDGIFPQVVDNGLGCTNQIARIFPSKVFYEFNGTGFWDKVSFLNVPIVDQPFDNYKIIVATAPKHIKLGRGEEAKPLVIYLIFNDDGVDIQSLKMPTIYFVSKEDGNSGLKKKEKAEPIFIIDSNRTVTGLKSTEVSKFVKFRNKLRNHFKFTPLP